MPKGGKQQSINPNFITRVAQGVQYAIKGIDAMTWFSPQQPLNPVAPESVAGRIWDYQPGYNLNIGPRPNTGGSDIYTLLRALADVDIVRAVIETRKDQIDALPWDVRLKEGTKGNKAQKILEIKTFLQQPDGYHTFNQWVGKLLEDMFVIDAATIYRRRDMGGRLIALDVMDGATIAVKIDEAGRIPLAPDVAFQQILHGIQAVDYDTTELFFMPRKLRNNTVYGYSPVEQIAATINLIYKRLISQTAQYDTANIPPGLLEFPMTMNEKQINDFMKVLNSRLSGNLGEQAKLFPVPSGTKYQEIKKPTLIEQQVEEWLTRVVCFAFSISPQPFVKEMNRATAETSHSTAITEGLTPIMLWLKRIFDRVIAIDMGEPDIEFTWIDDKEQDPKVQMEVLTGYAAKAVLSIDRVRDHIGEEPLGGAFAVPMVLTATGYVAVKSPEEQQADADAAAEMAQMALTAKSKDEEKDGKKPGDKPADKPVADDGSAAADKHHHRLAASYDNLAKGVRRKPGAIPFPAKQ